MQLSVVLPAKNEAEGLRRTLPALRERFPQAEEPRAMEDSAVGSA